MRLQLPDTPFLKVTEPGQTRGVRRAVYLAFGWFFLGMAVLGALLPVLPTTPFLLLTSYFFVRSSRRLNAMLLESRLFGPLLADWQKHRGVRLHVKISAIAVMFLSMTASITFGHLSLRLLALLIAGCTLGLVVVVRLPVIRQEAVAEDPPNLRLGEVDEAA